MTRARVGALLALTLALAAPLEGQIDPRVIPKRPKLEALGDTNSSIEYYWHGVSRLVKEPEVAAAAFYWAGRIDPSWAEPTYGRFVALLLAQPYNLLNVYMTRPRGDRRDAKLDAIDMLEYEALMRNPWVNRRMIGAVYATWLGQENTGGVVPRYLRTEFPALGAWMSYNEGKFEESAQEYAAALVEHPDDHILQFLRALPFVALGQGDSAITAVKAALIAIRRSTVDSLNFGYAGYPFLEYSLGILFARQQQLDSAQAAYERALLDDVTFAPAHRELGRIRLAAADTTAALNEFGQAVSLVPDDPVVMYELAVLSLAAGRPDSVLLLLQRATQAEPFFVQPHLALARLYDVSGFQEEAILEYRTFLRLAPRTMTAQVGAVRGRLAALNAGSSPP
jgi:Flp pilus assembly protein TadD